MKEIRLREQIATFGRSLFDRGYTHGASGNISVRVDGGWLMTPTNISLGTLDPATLTLLDSEGNHVAGDKPTKEAFLHIRMYESQPEAHAVVHLHSTHSVAVSCLDDIDEHDVLPPITAYSVMKVGKLPLVPYFAPGDKALANAVGEAAAKNHAVLLANHGPVVAGKSLSDAVYITEELEQTAKLFLLLRGSNFHGLTDTQQEELSKRFGS